MNIELLNLWAERVLGLMLPMLLQSSLLIGVLLGLDFVLRKRVQAVVRYTLWLVVLVKLVLPPSLALPSGAGWWLRAPAAAPQARKPLALVVSYGSENAPALPTPTLPAAPPPMPATMSVAAWGLVLSTGISLGLLLWMLIRWARIARDLRQAAEPPGWLAGLLEEARRSAGLRRAPRLRLTGHTVSPALCGLFRPIVLVPRALVDQLPAHQLRAILLHELIHLRRGDLWWNCVQSLLQVVYWWHPLLWLANGRIRRVREEAVDDAVLQALKGEAEHYAPTLLQVARLTLRRPLTSLGLVGILESSGSLRRRIERLLDFRSPRKTGLTLVSSLSVVAFAAVAVPMGQAPAPQSNAETSPAPFSPQAQALASPGPGSQNSTLVQDARLLYEMGKLDEAEGKLRQVIERDPSNAPANYYLNLIQETRRRSQVQAKQRPDSVRPSEPNFYSRTNASRGRQAIFSRLDQIRFEEVGFNGVPLGEVVRFLSDESRKRDPMQRGVNFIINSATNRAEVGSGQPQLGDISSIPIKISPALREIRLADVLDAIVKVADQPIKYSIEDYAVVFGRRSNEPAPLYTRIFKVDPRTFIQALESLEGFDFSPLGSLPGKGASGKVESPANGSFTSRLRNFFNSIGVDLNPPKTVFLNDREGTLLVRATLADLDTIEQAVQVLNLAPPQVNLKARFFAVPQALSSSLWNLVGRTNLPDAPSSSFTTVLTPAQLAVLLKAMDSASAVELLSEASVTTLSGRQTQIQAVDLQTIATNINPRALSPPGVSTNAAGPDALYLSTQVPFGPALDVIPYVGADESTIQLTATASLTEFQGYDAPTNHVRAYVEGKETSAALPLPHIRVRQMTTTAVIRDGQTLLLGTTPNPGTADANTRQLVVMLTPVMIDPAGNRLHPDDPSPRNGYR